MNTRKISPLSHPRLSSLFAGLMLAFAGATVAYADDDSKSKLEELKRAMTAPHDGAHEIGTADAGTKKKIRTRAIVFDNEPQAAAPGAPAAELAKAAKPVAKGDCSGLPPDVKANAVDFAIQFKVGSAEISTTSEMTLNEIAKILSLSPERCVLVEGHTDSSGNAEKNMLLSRERANSVVNYITDKAGIDRSRIIPSGKGSSDPLKNLDPRDPKNRRVVFKVVAG
ncbi:MAG: OmpA family protein [Betaproteobacteria bacterium]|nr:OmpA family protein [Betaproteobacteria bacterium]